MKKCHLKVLLFIKILNLVQSDPITSEQVGCVEGPVLPGQSQPKLNIRVLPSLSVPSFSQLNIVCDASAARKINGCMKLPKPPLPPTRILINIGVYLVKECISPTNVNQCTYNLTAFFKGIPPRISCTAFDAIGECRFKIVNVSLVEEATIQRISRKETSKKNTKDYSKTNTKTTVLLTKLVPTMPTTASKSKKEEDDDNDKSNEENESDDNSDDDSDDSENDENDSEDDDD